MNESNKRRTKKLIDVLFDGNSIRQDYVRETIRDFEEQNNIDEETVRRVFKAFPSNKSVSGVLAKVIVLNNRYSAGLTDWKPSITNIDVISMTNHIVKLHKEIDNAWCNSDGLTAILNLSKIRVGDKDYNPLSFVTKYCTWSWLEDRIEVPIYDSYVAGFLYYLNNYYNADEQNDHGLPFYHEKLTIEKIKDYSTFCEVYFSFVKQYDIESVEIGAEILTPKQIDEFVWQSAKSLGIRLDNQKTEG